MPTLRLPLVLLLCITLAPSSSSQVEDLVLSLPSSFTYSSNSRPFGRATASGTLVLGDSDPHATQLTKAHFLNSTHSTLTTLDFNTSSVHALLPGLNCDSTSTPHGCAPGSVAVVPSTDRLYTTLSVAEEEGGGGGVDPMLVQVRWSDMTVLGGLVLASDITTRGGALFVSRDAQRLYLYVPSQSYCVRAMEIRLVDLQFVKLHEACAPGLEFSSPEVHFDAVAERLLCTALFNTTNTHWLVELDLLQPRETTRVLAPPGAEDGYFFLHGAVDATRRRAYMLYRNDARDHHLARIDMDSMQLIDTLDFQSQLVQPVTGNLIAMTLLEEVQVAVLVPDYSYTVVVIDLFRFRVLYDVSPSLTYSVFGAGLVLPSTSAVFALVPREQVGDTPFHTAALSRLNFGQVFCPPGTAPNSTNACVVCDDGLYVRNELWGRVCEPAPPGSFAQLGAQALCSRGRFADEAGLSLCEACDTGYFANSTGSLECTACGTGTIANESAASTCWECPAGTFQGDTGRSSCSPCLSGTFSNASRTAACSACPAGSFSPTGATVCEPCEAGAFSLESAGRCTNCPKGTFQPTPGSSACLDCTSGRYNDVVHTIECSPCPVGTYGVSNRSDTPSLCVACPGRTTTPGEAARSVLECNQCVSPFQFNASRRVCECAPGLSLVGETCQDCPNGFFKRDAGNFACSPCPALADTVAAGTQCDCPVGFTLSATDGCICPAGSTLSNSQRQCLPCRGSFFKPDAGNGACSACPPNALSVDGLECRCQTGFYTLTNGDCQACPARGARCQDGRVITLAGWFQPRLDRLEFVQCRFADACLENNQCSQGYSGPLCSQCASGYIPAGGSRCVKCDSVDWGNTFVSLLPFVALVVFVYVAAGTPKRVLLGVGIHYLQILAQLPNESIESGVVDVGSVLEFDLFALVSDRCTMPLTYTSQFYLRLATPLVLMLAYTVLVVVGLGVRRMMRVQDVQREDSDDNHNDVEVSMPASSSSSPAIPKVADDAAAAQRDASRSVGAKLCYGYLSISMLTYVLITKTALATFVCRDVAGEDRLVAYYGLRCWEGSHSAMLAVSTVVLVFFSVGFPCILACLLMPRLQALTPSLRKYVSPSFMAEPFTKEFFFWEVHLVARRFVYLVELALLEDRPAAQAFGMTLLLSLFFLVHVWAAPFASPLHNTLESVAFFALEASFAAALLAFSASDSATAFEYAGGVGDAVSAINGVAIALVFTFLALELIKPVHRRWVEWGWLIDQEQPDKGDIELERPRMRDASSE